MNILPRSVANRLSAGESVIADYFDNVTILFLDLSGFTAMSSTMTPQEVVTTLNSIFTGFDDIVVHYGAEKIKTIGDCIMIATGLPEKRPDHARVMLQIALELVQHVHRVNAQLGSSINFRIGLNSGPVVAGVIGKVKYCYDCWSDSVNIASRMESTAPLGCIQVSRATYEQTYAYFEFEERGMIPVKGKGEMLAYICKGPKSG
jgi:class 3 adenylate cyclase